MTTQPKPAPVLPPLPKPSLRKIRWPKLGGGWMWHDWGLDTPLPSPQFEMADYWNLEQMQAYALKAIEAQGDEVTDALEEFDHRLTQWAKAYPLSVFPEPDYKAVQSVLKEHGMTLDNVSAGNMRHVAQKLNELFDPVRAAIIAKDAKP